MTLHKDQRVKFNAGDEIRWATILDNDDTYSCLRYRKDGEPDIFQRKGLAADREKIFILPTAAELETDTLEQAALAVKHATAAAVNPPSKSFKLKTTFLEPKTMASMEDAIWQFASNIPEFMTVETIHQGIGEEYAHTQMMTVQRTIRRLRDFNKRVDVKANDAGFAVYRVYSTGTAAESQMSTEGLGGKHRVSRAASLAYLKTLSLTGDGWFNNEDVCDALEIPFNKRGSFWKCMADSRRVDSNSLQKFAIFGGWTLETRHVEGSHYQYRMAPPAETAA